MCVNCHRGITLKDKITVFYEEVKNTLKYFTMKIEEPGFLNNPFPDINCSICHKNFKPGSKFHINDTIDINPNQTSSRRDDDSSFYWLDLSFQ